VGFLNWRRLGFTLPEVLSVITIVTVLTAMTFPVMQQSLRSAKRTHAVSNLKQLWIGFELYRQDHEGSNLAGPNPYSQVGVSVSVDDLFRGQCGSNRSCLYRLIKSPCSPHPSDITTYAVQSLSGIGEGYHDPNAVNIPDLRVTLPLYGEQHPAFIDMSCTDLSERYDVPDSMKLGLGVLFNGTLVVRRGRGYPYNPSWWVTNPGN
jgi:prepilin-type N-terminal cleavage/methylation domain-containing protein